MSSTPARNYTRLTIAIVIAAVVVGAGVITASYVGPTTTETRTSTSTTTATETFPLTITSTYIQTTTEFITTNLFQARTAVCQYGYTMISTGTETETSTATTTTTTATRTVTNTGPTEPCTGSGAAQCGGVKIENASLTVSGTSPNPATSGSNLSLTIQNTGNYASTALNIILSNITLLSTSFLWQPGSVATCSLYIPLSEFGVTFGMTYQLAAETFSGTTNHLSDDAFSSVYVKAN